MSSILTNSRNVNISNGTFNAITQITTIASAPSTLEKLAAAAAHTALHNAPARTEATRCHPDTRSNVLNLLAVWARDISQIQPLFWLHGGAGAGKSAVMQTLAERFVMEGLMLGCFFFSRNDPSRNSASVLAATMAYQLLQSFPSLESHFEAVISQDPLVFTSSIQHQFLHLLVNPLRRLVEERNLTRASQCPRIFLIDGLDECIDRAEQRAIIQAIAAVNHAHHLPIKFLVASRIELDISTAFRTSATNIGILQSTSLSNDIDSQRDIRHFVEGKFQTIRAEHPFCKILPSDWPSADKVSALVHKSSSHFVYAATAMRYISSPRESPVRALDVVLGLERARTENPFSELDALYRHILLSAAHRDKVMDIIIVQMSIRHYERIEIFALLLGCLPQDIIIFLADVSAIITIQSFTRHVLILHASLWDFLDNKLRCGPELHIEKAIGTTQVLHQYFVARSRIKQNPADHVEHKDKYFLFADMSALITYAASVGGHAHLYEVLKRHNLREIYPSPWPHFGSFLFNCTEMVVAIHNEKANFRDAQIVADYAAEWLELYEENRSQILPEIAPAIAPLLSTAFYPLLYIIRYDIYATYETFHPHWEVQREIILTSAQHSLRLKSMSTSTRMAHGAESILMAISPGPVVDIMRNTQGLASRWDKAEWLKRQRFNKAYMRMLGAASINSFIPPSEMNVPRRGPSYASPFRYTTSQPLKRLRLCRDRMRIAWLRVVRSDWRANRLFMRPDYLCDALIHLLHRSGFSERLLRYSNALLPLWLYQFFPKHAHRMRKALDKYRARVTRQRNKSLSVRIAQGDCSALIEKTRMLDIDALD